MMKGGGSSGLYPCILLELMHKSSKPWGYDEVLFHGLHIACNANKSTFDFHISMFLFDCMVRINSCKGKIVFADDIIE